MTQAGNAALDTAAKRPTFCGTTVTDEEWSVLTEIIATCGLSRHELARTICEGLGWVRRNGNLKTRECYEYLEVVEAKGLVTLPPRHEQRRRGPTSIHYTKAGRERPRREGKLSDVAPVMLGLVANAEERALWRELVARYHYLGPQGGLWRAPAVLGLDLESSAGALWVRAVLLGGAVASGA